MKKMKIVALVCMILGMSVQAYGTLATMGSADFGHKYEGGTSFGSEYTAYGASWSSDGDILHYSIPTSAPGSVYFQSNTWAAAGVQNTGYTTEVRLKIDASSPSSYQFFMFQTSTDTCDDIRYLVAKTGIVRVPGSGSPVTVYAGDMTSEFHTIRVAHEGSSGDNAFPTTYALWVDGTLVSDGISVTGSGPYNAMYWAGGSGDVAGAADVDYVRWTTGAYAPVPEPATMILLGLGAVSFLRRKG